MEAADEDAEIIFGTVIDDSMGENIKVTVIATGLRVLRKETNNFASRTVPAPVYEAPVAVAAPVNVNPSKIESRYEAPLRANDYAAKSEITFDFEETKIVPLENKPKINWSEKLQNAASKYESQKNFEAPIVRPAVQAAPKLETRPDYSHFDNSAPQETSKNENNLQASQNRESRIKSIAEKLGFFNFDEDEFDTPSFMKKNEKNHDSQV